MNIQDIADCTGLDPELAELLEAKRKISVETADALGIVGRQKAIGFKYLDPDGRQLFVKARLGGKGFARSPSGAASRLYNLPAVNLLREGVSDTLVITEGELDAASVFEVGYACVMSVPNGAPSRATENEVDPLEDKQFSYLFDEDGTLREEVALPREIILATDGDKPGEILAGELATRLGPSRCRLVEWPEGCKDANDVLVKLGPDALIDVIASAPYLIDSTFKPISQMRDLDHKGPYDAGWADCDRCIKLRPPELVVVTGTPGSGKSLWTLQWLMRLSERNKLRGAIIQFENSVSRLQREVDHFCQWWSKDDPLWGDRNLIAIEPKVDESQEWDLNWLKERIAEAATRFGAAWILIDPWNEVEHMFDRSMREDQYINDALRMIRLLARRYQVSIILVAHPDKAAGVHGEVDKMSLYSISGGSSWANKADGGIVLGRLKNSDGIRTNKVQVRVVKRRDQPVAGEEGEFWMEYLDGSYRPCPKPSDA